MAEWSKAVHSSCTLFGGVSSNLTGCNKKLKKNNNNKNKINFLKYI